jgi:glycosyltransferase involved in cell wall biosynthesis
VDAPRIAVIIPFFNDVDFVEEAIASIVEDGPVEVVVVDDGSTDPRTAETLARVEAGGAKVVRRENGGPSAARMSGLAATTARYVFPLDSDDRLEPGCLGVLADRLDAAPEIAFTYGHLRFFGAREGGREAQAWDPYTLLYANRWGAPLLLRRTALDAVGGWSLADCYEDWDILLALAEHGFEGAPVDQLVLHYRRHEAPRMNVRSHGRHAELYRILEARHARLFSRRAELARAAGAPRWRQLAYPLLLGARPLYPWRVFYAIEAFNHRRADRAS